MSRSALLARAGANPEELGAALDRLVETQRVQVHGAEGSASYSASEIVLGFGQASGWEGAVLDHFQALVRTICAKLALEPTARADDTVGGSTYTFDVWPEHPHYAEVLTVATSAKKRRRTCPVRTIRLLTERVPTQRRASLVEAPPAQRERYAATIVRADVRLH